MKTDGHYSVTRTDGVGMGPRSGWIRSINCRHCLFSVSVDRFFRVGDRSGQAKYNRARAVVVRHLHSSHRPELRGEDRRR